MSLTVEDFKSPDGFKAYWERGGSGAPRKFETPEELWEAAVEYFTWATENPLPSAKTVTSGGVSHLANVPKLRAFTIRGMALHMGIQNATWVEWRTSRPDLSEIMGLCEDIVYSQKFEGAASGLLSTNIIARDLGLVDKSAVDIVGVQLSHEQQIDRIKGFIPQLAPLLIELGWTPPVDEGGE